MLVILDGIAMLTSAIHPLNAPSPMLVTLSGSTTLVKFGVFHPNKFAAIADTALPTVRYSAEAWFGMLLSSPTTSSSYSGRPLAAVYLTFVVFGFMYFAWTLQLNLA